MRAVGVVGELDAGGGVEAVELLVAVGAVGEPGVEGLHHRRAVAVGPIEQIGARAHAVGRRNGVVVGEVLDEEGEQLLLTGAVVEGSKPLDDLLVDRDAGLAVGKAKEGEEVTSFGKAVAAAATPSTTASM